MTPGSAEYVVPFGFRVSGGLDVPALERAFSGLVERHETLRTRFAVDGDGVPRQLVGEPWPVTATVVDLDERAARELVDAEAHTPFDLASDRLLRVTVIRLAPRDHILLLCVHHIVADEWSLKTLIRDLSELYSAALRHRTPDLPALPVQYADFAVWQRTSLDGEAEDRQLAYWRENLRGLEQRLSSGSRGLRLLSVPNRRVSGDYRVMRMVAGGEDPADARRALLGRSGAPALTEIRRVADRTGHDLAVTWSGSADDGALDILFTNARTGHADLYRSGSQGEELTRYVNSPARSNGDGDLLRSVRRHVAERLPDFMVPSSMVLLAELPTTPNGKVDRRALPDPGHQPVAAGRPPRTATEELLCEVFAEILGVPTISIDNDFFESGGHSLLATRIVAAVRSRLGVRLSIRTLFEAPTVARLAESLGDASPDAGAIRPIRTSRHG